MKTFILSLLLLCSLSVYSQKKKSIRNLVKLIYEYEQDCYNDSTGSYFNFIEVNGDTIPRYRCKESRENPNYIGTWIYYVHETPRFNKFIVWLHKKYDRNGNEKK